MKLTRQFLALLAVSAVAVFSTGCAKLQSRDNLNKGVAAFKNAKYAEAAALFQKSAELDPTNENARLYLATAYMTQWIPGAESPENNEMAKNARAEFMKVYEANAQSTIAMASLASLSFNEGKSTPATGDGAAKRKAKFDEAKEWYSKLLQVDPQDKVAYYSLGVIAWENWYPVLMNARAKMSMKPEDPGPLKDKKVREELKAQYGQIVEDGIGSLRKALEVDKEYEDAMAYLNLLVRERADLADTPEAYKKDIEEADGWVQKTLETKKIKAEKAAKSATGITAGQ
jgi:tetratricopeptide (TPR) repeat protein